MLILKCFEAYSNSDKSNQVLKKHVKHHNFQNVNRWYINDFKHFSIIREVLFFIVVMSKVMMVRFPVKGQCRQ